MSPGMHTYQVAVEWTGNQGSGTSGYRAYGRDHVISAGTKPDILGSSDPAFRGDAARWNPEDLLVASTSACHKLWYHSLCAAAGIHVTSYRDHATGEMIEDKGTGRRFTGVKLRPHVTIRAGDDTRKAARIHHDAHAKCFIANSVNFAIECEPVIEAAAGSCQSES